MYRQGFYHTLSALILIYSNVCMDYGSTPLSFSGWGGQGLILIYRRSLQKWLQEVGGVTHIHPQKLWITTSWPLSCSVTKMSRVDCQAHSPRKHFFFSRARPWGAINYTFFSWSFSGYLWVEGWNGRGIRYTTLGSSRFQGFSLKTTINLYVHCLHPNTIEWTRTIKHSSWRETANPGFAVNLWTRVCIAKEARMISIIPAVFEWTSVSWLESETRITIRQHQNWIRLKRKGASRISRGISPQVSPASYDWKWYG